MPFSLGPLATETLALLTTGPRRLSHCQMRCWNLPSVVQQQAVVVQQQAVVVQQEAALVQQEAATVQQEAWQAWALGGRPDNALQEAATVLQEAATVEQEEAWQA